MNNTVKQESIGASILQFFKEESEFLYLIDPLLKALHWPGSYKHLIEVLPHYSRALDLTGFRNVMAQLNYVSQSIEIKQDQVVNELLPALFIPEDNHAVILIEETPEGIYGFDSQSQSYQVFDYSDTIGELYYFQHTDASVHKHDQGKWFQKNIRRFKGIIGQILFLSIFTNLAVLVTPLFIMGVFDSVFSTNSTSMLWQLTVGVGIVLAGSFFLNKMRSYMLSFIGARMDITVGDAILEHLLFLPPSYTENAPVGSQIAKIKDFDSIRDFFTSPNLCALFEFPFAVLFLSVIWMLAGWIVVIPIGMLGLFTLLYILFNPVISRSISKSSISNAKKQSFQLESLVNMRAIRLLGVNQQWFDRFKSLTSNALMHEFQASIYTQTLNIISETIMMLSGMLVISFGVIEVLEGNMSVGALIATMILVWRVLSPIKTFFSILPRFTHVLTSIKQINQLMHLPIERDPHKIVQPLNLEQGQVECNRVSFRYRQDMIPTLLGISFKVNTGELVAVCGQNGSGKSTLLKVMADMYSVQGGSILINGINIKQLDLIELRQTMGYLPQNSCLFFGTIAQNLRFSAPLATMEDLIQATIQAGVYDEICDLPDGFDTQIRDNAACQLPKSFQQKLLLARTWLKKSKILLLDEPINNLDHEMTEQFNQHLLALKGKSTIFLVTHRPTQMKMADRILFLEQGHLIYDGPPSDVLPKISPNLL